MSFRTRNLYYLRISANMVLPLYLYLDEKHVGWMSDKILQYVFADLRGCIIQKLVNEADAQLGPGGPSSAKRGTLDVHKGDTYQFGYFLRKTDAHNVVVKARTYTTNPARPGKETSDHQQKLKDRTKTESPIKAPEKGKNSSDVSLQRPTRTSKTQSCQKQRELEGDGEPISADDESVCSDGCEELGARGSPQGLWDSDYDPTHPDVVGTCDTSTAIKQEETEFQPFLGEEPMDTQGNIRLSADTDKPTLKLGYQSFNIRGRCLCVIVEPYPPTHSATTAQAAPTTTSSTNDVAEDTQPAVHQRRSPTPLFLPEPDDNQNDAAPLALKEQVQSYTGHFWGDINGENQSPTNGIFELSQILRSVGGYPTATVDENDEMEGAVLFGDADEIRGL